MGAGRSLRAPARRQRGVDRDRLEPIQIDEGLALASSSTSRSATRGAAGAGEERTVERTNHELDEFAHVVSHDLKAPLRGIISLSTWIAEDCAERLPKESHEHLQLLVERTRSMSELIDGILHYSRAGREGSPAGPVDVGKLVREVIDSLARPSIRVHVEPAPDRALRPHPAPAGLQNLLMNAIQHLDDWSAVRSLPEEPRGARRQRRRDRDRRASLERIFCIFQALRPDAPTAGVGLAIVMIEKNRAALA
jgi:light-regulated signal transduction histidine kinase (bacteriophytochrome)